MAKTICARCRTDLAVLHRNPRPTTTPPVAFCRARTRAISRQSQSQSPSLPPHPTQSLTRPWLGTRTDICEKCVHRSHVGTTPSTDRSTAAPRALALADIPSFLRLFAHGFHILLVTLTARVRVIALRAISLQLVCCQLQYQGHTRESSILVLR